MFPFAGTQGPGENRQPLSPGNSGMLAGLLELIDQIPQELITLEGSEYANFAMSLAAIRDSLVLWRSGTLQALNHTLAVVPGLPALNPVTFLRLGLIQCPDEAPNEATIQLLFVTDTELRASIRLDVSAANANLVNGEWKGATVLAGAAVEALLLWAVQNHESLHAGSIAGAIPELVAAATLARRPGPNPEQWNLHEYTEVAAALRIIGAQTADQVRQARNFRNLIHPGRATRIGQSCHRGTALAALAAVELVVRDLTP